MQRQLGGLDHASLQQGSDAGGLAGEEGFLERGEAFGDFAHGCGLRVARVQAIGERAGAGGESVFKPGESEFGQLDISVGDGLAQGEAARPLEGLGDGNRPCVAFADEATGGVFDALATEIEGQFRIGPRGGVALPGFGDGDLVLVELAFRILGGDFTHQGRKRNGGRGFRWWGGLGRKHGGSGEEKHANRRSDEMTERGQGMHEK